MHGAFHAGFTPSPKPPPTDQQTSLPIEIEIFPNLLPDNIFEYTQDSIDIKVGGLAESSDPHSKPLLCSRLVQGTQLCLHGNNINPRSHFSGLHHIQLRVSSKMWHAVYIHTLAHSWIASLLCAHPAC